jgi:signal transduction histidine kinase/CheY-like chemotaxis protein
MIVVLGARGTRWLFAIVIASALCAWTSESLLGVIDPNDRIAYPLITAAFALLLAGVWRRPQHLQAWQRCGVTLLALYFSVGMLMFTLRPDPGPSLYTLGSYAPWSLGACLLLFTSWRARDALRISLGLLALMLAPPTLLRFAGRPPHWLQEAWPLLANLALSQAMFCLALWGLSRQLARLTQLAPATSGPATTGDLVNARLAELERSRAAAEAASRAKSDFLASIGHEIRTPMNTVLGLTRLLLAGRLLAEQRGRLQEVASAGESLVRLIDGLLDFAALDAGRLQLARQPLRIEALLASAFDTVRAQAQGKQLELLCDIASPELLGEAGSRWGDAARLRQLFTELLVNAVKFTPAGQVRLSVQLLPGEQILLRVRDSGVGMSPSQLAALFSPFAQAEADVSRRYGGAGLGLAVGRALAERMGGSLTATSVLGRGSEFELRLPLPPCPELPAPPRPATRSVLLVQAAHSADHAALLALLAALAPQARIEVETQGASALARLANGPTCDLLLVDWVLPDMEGNELLARLAQQSPQPTQAARRIALLSAFDTPALRDKALRLGAQALCAKPLLPHQVRALLDLQHPLPGTAAAAAGRGDALAGTPADTDVATLLSELDTLLRDADSHALTLWEQHESAFLDLLPAPQLHALAGAMQRFDFDAAQAALRGTAPEGSKP